MADEPWAFWWELMEMTRRLVLVGIFVLLNRGSVMQIVLGTIFSAVYLLMITQAGPFKQRVDDFLGARVCVGGESHARP